MTFNPKDHVMDMRGKDYLEVKWRLVWFREEYPTGRIETEVVQHDPVLMKATVFTDLGCTLASGYGTAKMQGVAKSRPYEGAETAAIGRALAHAGFGSQFTGEDEGENLADSPVERTQPPKKAAAPTTVTASQKMFKSEIKQAIVDKGLAENAFAAAGMLDHSNLPLDVTTLIAIAWANNYRSAREDGKTTPEAAELANSAYTEYVNSK